ncbi:MAG: class I SAM-dependent methyltransferase [Gemmataceae bacterium]
MSPLIISRRDIRRFGKGAALGVLWRQWRAERRLARAGVHFRDTDPAQVAAAYAAMSEADYEAINARQDWANWRTIPRALSGHVPDRPLRILDLGCGAGGSAAVLAFYAPPGSHVTGYEIAEPLLAFARRRAYRRRDGAPAQVDFRAQGVTEPFRDIAGELLPDRAVDVVNASGVVGHHLTGPTIGPLIDELKRTLHDDGAAMLDVGPTLGQKELTAVMQAAGFVALGRYRSWFGDPTGQVVFRRASASSGGQG